MVQQLKIEDFSNYVIDNLEKITVKRFSALKPQLTKEVNKVTEQYFVDVADKAIGVLSNPFKRYSTKSWKPLTPEYVRRKGHSEFWWRTGELNRWLRSETPSTYFGKPYIDIRNFNPTARGLQNMDIIVRPFPYKNPENRFPKLIYNRLFAKRKVSSLVSGLLDSKVSNDDMRPIMAPTMQILINNKLKQKITRTIKEVINNG